MGKMVKTVVLFFMSMLAIHAEDVTVKVAVTGPNNSRTRIECATKSKKAAVVKYLRNLDPQMQDKIVEAAVASYKKWIDEVQKPTEWDYEDGDLTGEFIVSVKKEELLQFLSGEGWTPVGGNPGAGATKLEVVIAEEPPDAGMMKIAEQMGLGKGGQAEFFQRYTMFQRRVRDALVKEVGKIGIEVPLLEDNPAYEDLKKSGDKCCVGCCFDPNVEPNGDFKVTQNFVELIRDNNPDTVVLYYRIDTITYDREKQNIRVSVSLGIKNLATGAVQTQSLGSQDWVSPQVSDKQVDILIANMAVTVTSALHALLSGEGMNDKVMATIKRFRASENGPKGSLQLVVNGSKVDKKIRDDFLLDLEDGLVKAGLCKEKEIKSRGNTVSCVITSTDPKMKDPRRLWRAIKKVLKDAGLDEEMVTDDIKTVNGNVITVTPGK